MKHMWVLFLLSAHRAWKKMRDITYLTLLGCILIQSAGQGVLLEATFIEIHNKHHEQQEFFINREKQNLVIIEFLFSRLAEVCPSIVPGEET